MWQQALWKLLETCLPCLLLLDTVLRFWAAPPPLCPLFSLQKPGRTSCRVCIWCEPSPFTVLQLTSEKACPFESATALLQDLNCIGDMFSRLWLYPTRVFFFFFLLIFPKIILLSLSITTIYLRYFSVPWIVACCVPIDFWVFIIFNFYETILKENQA